MKHANLWVNCRASAGESWETRRETGGKAVAGADEIGGKSRRNYVLRRVRVYKLFFLIKRLFVTQARMYRNEVKHIRVGFCRMRRRRNRHEWGQCEREKSLQESGLRGYGAASRLLRRDIKK